MRFFNTWLHKRIVLEFKKGDKYDVKDTENIWCTAVIEDIFKQKHHSDILLIRYDGWDQIYNEYICSKSDRIAPLGFYTKRRDIPQYRMDIRNPNQQLSYIISDRDGFDVPFYIFPFA